MLLPGDRPSEGGEEDDHARGDEHVSETGDSGDHLVRLLTQDGQATVPDEHSCCQDHTCVVQPEKPGEQFPALGDGEHLLEAEHDQENEEAQGEQMRVCESELSEFSLRKIIEFCELAIEQARHHTDKHVDEGSVEQFSHGFTFHI